MLILVCVIGCKSSKESSYSEIKTKDSIITNTSIKYIQKPLEYSSSFELSNKPFRQTFKNNGVTTSISKDSLSNRLEITNTVDADTILTVRDRSQYFNNISIKDSKEEEIRYTPNKFNWTIPLILGAVIVLLIASKKFDLFKIGLDFVKKIIK